MGRLKFTARLVSLSFVVGCAAASEVVPKSVEIALKPFDRLHTLTYPDHDLHVRLNQLVIRHDAFKAVALAVCSARWSNKKAWTASTIKRVSVFNSVGKQGWAMDKAQATCDAWGVGSDAVLEFATLKCVAGICRKDQP